MKFSAPVVCLFALVLAGCESTKSENPLSPSVAGPLPGVEIGAPRPLEPKSGSKVVSSPPVALTIQNTTSSGPRPISYAYEVSADVSFQSTSYSGTTAPGADGKTSVTPPDKWTNGTTYYWRVRAVDGANNGPWSEISTFHVVEKVTLGAPQLIGPGNGQVVGIQPTLQLTNVARTGEPDGLHYEFQVSSSLGFESLASASYVEEQADVTSFVASPLDGGRTYFWRARATEATTTSDWSAVFFFVIRSTSVPSPAPSPAPAPGPSGGASGIPYGGSGPAPSDREGVAMIEAVKADLRRRGISMSGDCGAFEITRRVAWAFRDRGAGLESKTYGRQCQLFSQDIVLFSNGTSVDILIGGGNENGASWQVHSMSDWRSYFVAPPNPD